MAWRFKGRPAAPGEYTFTQASIAVLADYPDELDVLLGVDYGNGSLFGVFECIPGTPEPTPGPTPTPAALTIIELIALNVKAKLDVLVTAGALSEAQRPVREGILDAIGDRGAILFQGDTDEDADQVQGYKSWITPFEVYLCARPSDGATTPIDSQLNAMRAAVEKALLADFTGAGPLLGGYATNAYLLSPNNYATGDALCGVGVMFRVHYRHVETDPFSQ